MTSTVLFWALVALAFAGALTVVLTRDVMRLALGLGGFLLAVAGLFALFGFGFLALAEVFLYVGGVLVLVLFAIMLVHRTVPGRPALESVHDLYAVLGAVGVSGLLVFMLRPLVAGMGSAPAVSVSALGDVLLGDLLPQFELAGLLLLAALVAVVAVSGGEDR